MIEIRYISPFSIEKPISIGREYNKVISELPNDCWVCLRDWDTLPMMPESKWGIQINDIILRHGNEFDLIGCLTNRLAGKHQLYKGRLSDDPNINNHLEIGKECFDNDYDSVVQIKNAVAGMFMLFHKSTWERFKFVENAEFEYLFDTCFSEEIIRSGGKIGIATGVYMFHLYRWGKMQPTIYKKHLLK